MPLVVASILDFRPAGQFMNLDVFFTFSDMRVCFRQVANSDSV
ncbi:hypothetical protein BRPE64_BCDS13830 [Caballeronia insecticola]|uniref:Uncharacterized protein n=1 Tax=Caballeronia insecticola TaxID=758793 RepID=R4WNC4_9BURK|nr:hypothetical protein BRPE64_BCDS13830 [Caballeronia insecticola]